MNNQFTEKSIGQIFKPGQAGTISKFILIAKDDSKHDLGKVSARFLRFTNGDSIKGLVLRFSNLSEFQIDLLNEMICSQPDIPENRENIIRKLLARMD